MDDCHSGSSAFEEFEFGPHLHFPGWIHEHEDITFDSGDVDRPPNCDSFSPISKESQEKASPGGVECPPRTPALPVAKKPKPQVSKTRGRKKLPVNTGQQSQNDDSQTPNLVQEHRDAAMFSPSSSNKVAAGFSYESESTFCDGATEKKDEPKGPGRPGCDHEAIDIVVNKTSGTTTAVCKHCPSKLKMCLGCRSWQNYKNFHRHKDKCVFAGTSSMAAPSPVAKNKKSSRKVEAAASSSKRHKH